MNLQIKFIKRAYIFSSICMQFGETTLWITSSKKCTQQQTNHNSSSLGDDLPYILVERNFGEFSQICTNRTKCVNGNSVYTNCAHIGLLQNLNVVLQDSVMQCLSRPCIHFRIGVTYIYRPDCPCMCCIKCQHKSKHELVRDAVNWQNFA